MVAMMPAQSNPFVNRENMLLVIPEMGINYPQVVALNFFVAN